jgi:hypothetical protein
MPARIRAEWWKAEQLKHIFLDRGLKCVGFCFSVGCTQLLRRSYPHPQPLICVITCYNDRSGSANGAASAKYMSSISSSPRNYRTGVSLEPEVVRSLDELVVQTGLNRSWVLNTIVREYLHLAAAGKIPPVLSREAIINA